MSIHLQFTRLRESGAKLLAAIEGESWDATEQYTQQWDKGIRDLFNCLSSDQYELYKSEFEDFVIQNQIIIEKLTLVRANSLTQLQKFNELRNANLHYRNSI